MARAVYKSIISSSHLFSRCRLDSCQSFTHPSFLPQNKALEKHGILLTTEMTRKRRICSTCATAVHFPSAQVRPIILKPFRYRKIAGANLKDESARPGVVPAAMDRFEVRYPGRGASGGRNQGALYAIHEEEVVETYP